MTLTDAQLEAVAKRLAQAIIADPDNYQPGALPAARAVLNNPGNPQAIIGLTNAAMHLLADDDDVLA